MTDRVWKKVTKKDGGNYVFFKWNDPGDSIEGVWKGETDGKYGPLGLVEDELDGQIKSFPLHTVLIGKMEEVEVGSFVKIEYLGLSEGRRGSQYKNFEV